MSVRTRAWGVGAQAARRTARRLGIEVVRRGRYDLVRRDPYSPVPHVEELPPDTWQRKSPLAGVDLGVDRALAWVESELAPYLAEFDLPLHGPRPAGEFYVFNDNYEAVESELLYAIVRARRPRRVLELGSGFTTLLIGVACRRNAADGATTEHVAYDPYPRPQVLGGPEPPPPTTLRPISATDVPLEAFRELEAGDVLFVDTTHTVKVGGEVNRLVLEVLPELAPGVLVHFHDIFLPWNYPREWIEREQYYWAEQYLLQAFLAFNPTFEVLLPVHVLAREHADRLRRLVPSFAQVGRSGPNAMWLVKR
ncbi:MAG TPA: class I SAM-dependent methyltransferase [Solirubrobacteraceae bacterium]|nr:class I SAM-dependent methyltransferase [Solirubrobacteraceae bacterium]